MSGLLPVVSGRDVVKALEKTGYRQDRQTGSHIILRCLVPPAGLEPAAPRLGNGPPRVSNFLIFL